MANLFSWYVRSNARKVACGQCVDLIAGQEYTVGHPHMHLQDGFELTFKGDTSLSLTEQGDKKLDWGPVVHLHPTGSQRLAVLGDTDDVPKDKVSIRAKTLPGDDSYLKRTGLKAKALVPAVMGTKKIPIMDKTTKLQKTDKDGNPMWVMTGSTPKEIPYVVTPEVPAVAGTIPHSIFEDGESAIMSLAAVFNSKSGRKAFNLLHLGVAKVVIRSQTAVAALTAATKASSGTSSHSLRGTKIRMQEWRHDTLAGTYKPTTIDLDHVVTVMKRSSSSDLILTTHYPVGAAFTETATEGVTVAPADLLEWKPAATLSVSDPAEILFGFAQDYPLPPIAW